MWTRYQCLLYVSTAVLCTKPYYPLILLVSIISLPGIIAFVIHSIWFIFICCFANYLLHYINPNVHKHSQNRIFVKTFCCRVFQMQIFGVSTVSQSTKQLSISIAKQLLTMYISWLIILPSKLWWILAFADFGCCCEQHSIIIVYYGTSGKLIN